MIPAIDDARIRRNRRERPWTPEHDALLLKLKQAGLTIAVIAERLGRTPDACTSRVYNLSADDERVAAPPKDYLGEKVELYLATIFRLNRSAFADVRDLKVRAYGWR